MYGYFHHAMQLQRRNLLNVLKRQFCRKLLDCHYNAEHCIVMKCYFHIEILLLQPKRPSFLDGPRHGINYLRRNVFLDCRMLTGLPFRRCNLFLEIAPMSMSVLDLQLMTYRCAYPRLHKLNDQQHQRGQWSLAQ